MFCNKCGNGISNQAAFCSKCGEKTNLPINKKNPIKKILLLTVPLVIVLAVGLILLLHNKLNDDIEEGIGASLFAESDEAKGQITSGEGIIKTSEIITYDGEGKIKYSDRLEYDRNGNMIAYHEHDKSGYLVLSHYFEYDEKGNKLFYHEFIGNDRLIASDISGGTPPIGNTLIRYENSKKGILSHSQKYEYDDFGHILLSHEYKWRKYNPHSDFDIKYIEDGNESDIYIGILAFSYEYDENGNIVAYNRHEYEHIYEQREDYVEDTHRWITNNVLVDTIETISIIEKYVYEYDESGNVLSIREYRGHNAEDLVLSSSYEYDEDGKLSTVTHNGHDNNELIYSIKHEYDQNGNELARYNYNKAGILDGYLKYEYDEMDKIITRHQYNADGTLSSSVKYENEYDNNGNVISILAYREIEDNEWELYESVNFTYVYHPESYDISLEKIVSVERLLSEIMNEAEPDEIIQTGTNIRIRAVKQVKYNSNSMNSETSARYEYDEKGNLLIGYSYDHSGNVVSYQQYEYDERGNVLSIYSHKGNGDLSGFIHYEYDERGNVLTIYDYKGNGDIYKFEHYEYDAMNNIVYFSIFQDNPRYESSVMYYYEYDNNGNILFRYNMNGAFDENIYDGKGNLIYRHNHDVNGIHVSSEKFEYDNKGNMTAEYLIYYLSGYYDEIDKKTIYEYDVNGNLLAKHVYYSINNLGLILMGTEEYDEKGEITAIYNFNDFNDRSSFTGSKFVNEYDQHGNIIVSYEYDHDGTLKNRTLTRYIYF